MLITIFKQRKNYDLLFLVLKEYLFISRKLVLFLGNGLGLKDDQKIHYTEMQNCVKCALCSCKWKLKNHKLHLNGTVELPVYAWSASEGFV